MEEMTVPRGGTIVRLTVPPPGEAVL